jgi:TolA-binding protein
MSLVAMYLTSTVSAKNRRRSFCSWIIFLSIQNGIPSAYAQEKHHVTQVTVKELEKEARRTENRKSNIASQKMLFFKSELDAELIKKMSTTIDYLQKLADESKRGSPQRFKLRNKILNLHFEQANYLSVQETYNFDAVWRQWEENDQKGPAPKLDDRLSRAQWKHLANIARELLKEYPQAKEADRILYNEAIAERSLEHQDIAAKVLMDLIHRYPNSEVIFDAQFALGEYYFDVPDFHAALSRFSKAL